MASMIREVLNADGMSLAAFCGGFANVGIGITGTWAGTLYFEEATFDNPNVWIASAHTPFASGTAVSSITANGNYFAAVKANVFARRVRFSRTSGSPQINIAVANDSSWQDAFLTQANIFNSSTVTSGTNTLTQSSQANRAWNLQKLDVSVAGPGWGGAGRVTIYDGTVAGTILWEEFLGTPSFTGSVGYVQNINIPAEGVVNTPGNAMTIVLRGMGNNSSILNAKFSAG